VKEQNVEVVMNDSDEVPMKTGVKLVLVSEVDGQGCLRCLDNAWNSR
jgi:hypothetical protein